MTAWTLGGENLGLECFRSWDAGVITGLKHFKDEEFRCKRNMAMVSMEGGEMLLRG